MPDSDGQISVEIVAKIDELSAGMAEAVDAVRSASEEIKSSLGGANSVSEQFEQKSKETSEHAGNAFQELGERFEHFKGVLSAALGVGVLNLFAETAKEVVDKVKEAIEATAGKAEEFALSNAKAAALLDTSEKSAAGLAAALRGVGSSIEEYEGLALRLQQRLESGGTITEKYKSSLSDANGQILAGQPLMEAAIGLIQQASTVQEKNAISTELFGRRAAALYDIMRAGKEDQQANVEILERQGVELDGGKEKAEAYERASNELKTAWDGLTIALGQKFLPTLTDWVHQIESAAETVGKLVTFIEKMNDALEDSQKEQGKSQAATIEWIKAHSSAFGSFYEWFAKLSGPDADLRQLATDTQEATPKVEELADAAKGLANDMGAAGHSVEELGRQLGALQGPLGSLEGGFKSPIQSILENARPEKRKGPVDHTAQDLAAERISAEQSLALAEIKIDQDTSAHRLAMGRETLAAFVTQARELEDQTYQVKLDALNKQLSLHSGPKAKGGDVVARQKDLDQIEQLEVAHRDAMLKIERDGATQQAGIDHEAVANAIRDDAERLKTGLASIGRAYKANEISFAQRTSLERELTQTVYADQIERLDTEIASLTQGTKAYEQAYRQREQIARQMTSEIDRINAESFQHMQEKVQQVAGTIAGPLDQAINGIIFHAKSLQDAMKELVLGIAEGFAGLAEKILEQWLVAKIAKTLLDESQVAGSAAVAGANAAAATAAIPGGAVAAIPAGLAMYSQVEATFAPLASAAGGMLLDRDQLVFAHKGEQILPAQISSGLQQIINEGGTSGGDEFHYAPTINAHETPDMAALLDRHGSQMIDWLRAKRRNGSL